MDGCHACGAVGQGSQLLDSGHNERPRPDAPIAGKPRCDRQSGAPPALIEWERQLSTLRGRWHRAYRIDSARQPAQCSQPGSGFRRALPVSGDHRLGHGAVQHVAERQAARALSRRSGGFHRRMHLPPVAERLGRSRFQALLLSCTAAAVFKRLGLPRSESRYPHTAHKAKEPPEAVLFAGAGAQDECLGQ